MFPAPGKCMVCKFRSTKALGASSAIIPKVVQLMWLSAGHGLCTLAEYFLVLNSEIRLRIWQVTRILSGVPGLLYMTGKMLNLGASFHFSYFQICDAKELLHKMKYVCLLPSGWVVPKKKKNLINTHFLWNLFYYFFLEEYFLKWLSIHDFL